MNFEIVEAKISDLQAILKLYAVEDLDDGFILPIDEAKSTFDKMQSYPNYKIYIARFDGKTVGTFSLLIMDNLAHLGKSSGIVEDVVVAKDMRSMGVGKKMMEYAMKICKENKCYKMCLSSNLKREAAHRFYENLGFKKHGYSFLIEL